MITNARTRIIVNGKILAKVSKFVITYDLEKMFPEADIQLEDEVIKTRLIGIEHVKGNSFRCKCPAEYWTQYTCELIDKTKV